MAAIEIFCDCWIRYVKNCSFVSGVREFQIDATVISTSKFTIRAPVCRGVLRVFFIGPTSWMKVATHTCAM